jgi:hypothetical protein
MIDLSTEATLTLADAAKLLPSVRMGRPVSYQCVLRWVKEGSRRSDGRIVKLEAVRLGGRLITSKEALQRFAEALTPFMAPKNTEPATAKREPACVHSR